MPGFPALLPEDVRAQGRILSLPQSGPEPSGKVGGTVAAIEVAAFTESMGTVEAALAQWSERLEAGGLLTLDVENRQSLSQLHVTVEGRPGPFDPVDNSADPSQALPLPRVLRAFDTAGLQVLDVLRVPHPRENTYEGLADALVSNGLMPLGWAQDLPPWRYWVVAQKCAPLAGSVLVGPGDAAAQRQTLASVESWLPDDWEVICAEDGHELAGWSSAVAQARGEFVWFLRAGATASEDVFQELASHATLGPAAPGNSGVLSHPGDITGLMIARNDLLQVGLFTQDVRNTQVAFEEYCVRIESCIGPVSVADGEFASSTAKIEDPERFAAEVAELTKRWGPLLKESAPLLPPPNGGPKAVVPCVPGAPPWQGREPRITLCMIVRNEERFLGECLRRAQDVVDEIVIVDTGSTDRTIEIARSFGAKVIEEPWADDFSAPRNTGLRAATGDWVLALDADEFLADGAVEQIRELVKSDRTSGYYMRFANLYTGGKNVGVVMVRLFRNLPGIEYCNFIHEQITPSLNALSLGRGLELSVSTVDVEHHGYADDVMVSRNKVDRNDRLFAKQLAKDPEDFYCLFKYGDFLRGVEARQQDSLDLLQRCFDGILASPPAIARGLPYAGEVAALLALSYSGLGQAERAQSIVDLALRRFVATPNLHYIAASLALNARQSDVAIAHYRRCLAFRGQVLVVPIQDGITNVVSWVGMAQALMQKGQCQRAEKLLRRALDFDDCNESAHLALSRLQIEQRDTGAALQTLMSLLARNPEAAGACEQAAWILQQTGFKDQARQFAARACELLRQRGCDQEAGRVEKLLVAK